MNEQEKLMVVAEKLGKKKVAIGRPDYDVMFQDDAGDYHIFDPSSNPAQLVDCIEWLLDRGWVCGKLESGLYIFETTGRTPMLISEGDSLADACINAIAGEDDE